MKRMRWTALFCLCGALLAASELAAQPQTPFEPSKINAARLRWLQYKMVAGRVVASSSYPDGMNISFGPSVIGGRLHEHLQLLILKEQASIRYELAGDGQQLSIVLAENGGFSINRKRSDPVYQMEFIQQPGKPLTLSLVEGDTERNVTAESFWHLYLAEPKLVTAELIPYLELLRPAWHLAATGQAIEDALVQEAQKPHAGDPRQWSVLVGKLGSPSFAQRESAQHELQRTGQVILPYLESLDRTALDAEQNARVSKLIAALSVDYEDTTGRIATWLAGDRGAWFALLAHPQKAKRRIAARQLEMLSGGPIEFDPAADAETRRAQLERLRPRFVRQTPATPADVKSPSVPPPGLER